jgi:hypothetical protein
VYARSRDTRLSEAFGAQGRATHQEIGLAGSGPSDLRGEPDRGAKTDDTLPLPLASRLLMGMYRSILTEMPQSSH